MIILIITYNNNDDNDNDNTFCEHQEALPHQGEVDINGARGGRRRAKASARQCLASARQPISLPRLSPTKSFP